MRERARQTAPDIRAITPNRAGRECRPRCSAVTIDAVKTAGGQVFVVRTRRAPCAFSNSIRYGKAKVLEVDATAGFIKFVAITNPFCNDRALIPPNQD